MSSTPEASAMQGDTRQSRTQTARAAREQTLREAKPVPTELPQSPPTQGQGGDVPSARCDAGTSADAHADMDASIEALIFSSDRPLAEARIALALKQAGIGGEIADGELRSAIARLNAAYEAGGRAFRIELLAGGYRVMTLPEHAVVVGAMQRSNASRGLSKPALETLAIIAYRQPITRADLEAIRGVSCGETLKSLLERRLIAITGRAEVLGRPMLYGTTRAFLDAFGLRSIKDLPQAQELAQGA